MTLINTVELIDEVKHIIRVGSGAQWVDVANTLQSHGLAVSAGDTKSVGVGGLTLGGGIGWLVRKVGLTIDNLVAAQVVTADGKTLQVSVTENPDLFWAIRGGGGNFGVVVSFEFTAYPIQTVFAGPISYPVENVSGVLKGWRDAMRQAPEELNSTVLVMPSFGGNPPAILILCCYGGADEAAAMSALKPLQSLGTVTMQAVKQKNYAEVLEEAHAPQGMEIITKNAFFKEFSDEMIAMIEEACKTAIPILQIRYLGGAMNRVSSDATAFPHRDSEVLIVSPVFLPPGASKEVIENAMKPWQALAVFGSGAYSNLLSTDTPEDVTSSYPQATYERLAKIKKIYDPENLFSRNYNIKPQ
jgi:FAD/FMN-containing dehydrogenase